MNGRVAARDGRGDDARALVERDVIYAKTPDEVIDVGNVFLMGLWSEKGFTEVRAVKDWPDLAEFEELRDSLTHDGLFTGTVVNLLHIDRGSTRFDDELVITDGYEEAFFRKNSPILDDEGFYQLFGRGRKMVERKLLGQAGTIFGFVEDKIEGWVDDVEGRGGVYALTENVATVHRAQDGVKLVRLVRKAAIVDEHILGATAALRLRGDANWRRRRRAGTDGRVRSEGMVLSLNETGAKRRGKSMTRKGNGRVDVVPIGQRKMNLIFTQLYSSTMVLRIIWASGECHMASAHLRRVGRVAPHERWVECRITLWVMMR